MIHIGLRRVDIDGAAGGEAKQPYNDESARSGYVSIDFAGIDDRTQLTQHPIEPAR
jgi:hypothetical protein